MGGQQSARYFHQKKPNQRLYCDGELIAELSMYDYPWTIIRDREGDDTIDDSRWIAPYFGVRYDRKDAPFHYMIVNGHLYEVYDIPYEERKANGFLP